MKKILYKAMGVLLLAGMVTGCSSSSATVQNATGNTTGTENTKSESQFDRSKEISVISREDGSGTRGAFIELFGIEEKDENGEKVDHTTDEAMITNSDDNGCRR